LLKNLTESIPYHDLKSTRHTFSVADDETPATHRRLEVTFGSRTEFLQARILMENLSSMATSILVAPPFLRDILSDDRLAPAPNPEGIIPPAVATYMEMGSHEATEEWENM
jgi:hypothetical protein